MKATILTLFLLSIFAFFGCNSGTPRTDETASTENRNASSDNQPSEIHNHHSAIGHAHGVGPHAGTIADWGGGKFHVEFTVDHDQQQATVYVLGNDEKTATPIDAESIELSITDPEMQVTLSAAPQEGDPEGMSSRFVGTHEKLSVVQEYSGTLTGVVDGTPYSGDFKEQAHGDHEH
ncbi:MAG: hypothetical protein R3C05_10610 [Pirellulaceae bacterium]